MPRVPGAWYPVRDVDYSLARDNDALIADNARKLSKINRLAEELVGLRLEIARLKAPPAPKQDFPMRALNRRTQSIGLITRWQP